ncbi:hypothetical protein V1505DRAFT_397956 [Lipomyces doorenjongii]
MESTTLLRDLLRDTSVPVTSTSSTSSASSSTSSTNATSLTFGGIAIPDLIRADATTQSSQAQVQQRHSVYLPQYESDQISGHSQSPTHQHSQLMNQQSAARQAPALRRAQSRYFEAFNNSQTQNGSAIDVGNLSNGMSGLNIANGPLPMHSHLHHRKSQQFDSFDGGSGTFLDSRLEGSRYDSSSMARGHHQLYHQASSEYVWKSMNQTSRPRSWFEPIQTHPQQQEYLPQPRMPFLNTAPYSTSPSSSGYSPSKSETVISESGNTIYSSSPQNRLQSRISQMSFSSTSSQQGPQVPLPQQQEQEDELIPTAIVIKNIPFAVKKEQLMELMLNLGLTLPYAFNYHFDNGVFRGLAFANFATSEDTASVIQALNGHDIAGRKLRVEYKKMLPAADRERIEREKRGKRGQLEEQHRSSYAQLPKVTMVHGASGGEDTSPTSVNARIDLDLNDPETLNFYSEILLFRDDVSREELVFGGTLTPLQRRNVHLLAHTMGLVHLSRGEGDMREVVVSRRPQPHSQSMLMYANRNIGIPEEYAGSNVDSRLLRGAKSFADIRSTARINALYPSTSNGNISSASTLYGHSLRAPQA